MTDEARIVTLAYDDVQALDVAGPAEVFSTATLLGTDVDYRPLLATPGGRSVHTDSGLRLGADLAIEDVDGPIDTLLIPGGLGAFAAAETSGLLTAIQRCAPFSRRVASVCTGAFVLAAAGLLDGRAATTHWVAAAALARRYPAVRVQPDRIFTADDGVHTSAGVTAGLDLTLSLVEDDHGPELAHDVARWLVVFPRRPGGQSQFASRLELAEDVDDPLRSVLVSIENDPGGDHRLAALATRAAVSERHLTRLFQRQLGTTPARFVERVRVEAGRDLLERSDLSVEQVARRMGFGQDETMRRAFLRILGVGPRDYRSRFRISGPAAPKKV